METQRTYKVSKKNPQNLVYYGVNHGKSGVHGDNDSKVEAIVYFLIKRKLKKFTQKMIYNKVLMGT